MGCQKEIEKKTVEMRAGYMLAVKLNQPTMYKGISTCFNWAIKESIERNQPSVWETPLEPNHDRVEVFTWSLVY